MSYTGPTEVLDEHSDRNPEIIRVWDSGAFLVKFSRAGGRYEPLEQAMYYVPGEDAYDDLEYWIGFDTIGDRDRRGRLYAELDQRTGFSTGDTMVPLSVVAEGKKAVVAYLFAAKAHNAEQIAHELDLKVNTVRQHLSDFWARR